MSGDFEPITLAEAAALSGLPDGPPMRISLRALEWAICGTCCADVAIVEQGSTVVVLDVRGADPNVKLRIHRCVAAL